MLSLITTLCLSVTGLLATTSTGTNQNEEMVYTCSETDFLEYIEEGEANSSFPMNPLKPPIGPIDPIDPIKPISSSIKIPYYSQKKFTSNFFKNCGRNVIANSIGNCGYTAISTLLAYYDNYWSDLFIPEEYENPTILSNNDDSKTNYYSPGIKNNTIFKAPDGFDKYTDERKSEVIHEFINEAIENKNESFLGLLLSYNNYIKENTIMTTLGVNYDIMLNILSTYKNNNSNISSYVTLVSNQIDKDNEESISILRNEIIVQLKKGNPLIIGGNGHVCIAYEYDENNDIIYGDLGWGKNYSHTNIDSFMENIIADYYYYQISNDLPHKHSYHYYNNETSKYICSCELLSHSHEYYYKNYDKEQHYRRCICLNDSELVNHFFTSSYWKNGNEYTVCGGCKYEKITTDSPTPIV